MGATWTKFAAAAGIALLLLACGPRPSAGGQPGPSAEPSASTSATPTATPAPSASPSATPAPSPTPSPGPSSTPTPTPADYIVQPGDSLGSIAAAIGFSLCAVEAANPQLGPDAGRSWDLINAGDAVHRPTSEAACPAPTPAPPIGEPPVLADRAIVVSLSEGRLWIVEGAKPIFTTLVNTGQPALPTPTGDFTVLAKQSPIHWISPFPYGSPYWFPPTLNSYQGLLFAAGGYYIHDADWQVNWGPGANQLSGSHGCINVPVGSMPTIYAWARVGDLVLVRE